MVENALVDWSRAQFALTAGYHWIFVPLTLGLAVIMATMETLYVIKKDEFWKKTGDIQGYHAVAVIGYDSNGFIIRNSWGDSYGHDGYAYIKNEDMQRAKESWTLI